MASAVAAVILVKMNKTDRVHGQASLLTSLIHTWPSTLFAHFVRWQTTRSNIPVLLFHISQFIFLFSFQSLFVYGNVFVGLEEGVIVDNGHLLSGAVLQRLGDKGVRYFPKPKLTISSDECYKTDTWGFKS